MRLVTLTPVLLLLLYREGAWGETPDVIQEYISLGGTITFTIRNDFTDVVTGCYLETPYGDLVQFRPESNSTNADLALQPIGMLSSCSVAVRNLKEEYLGYWTLISDIRDPNHEFRLVQQFQVIDRDAPVKESSEDNLESENSKSQEEATDEPYSTVVDFETTTHESELTTENPESTTVEPEPTIDDRENYLQTIVLSKILYETPLRNSLETMIPGNILRTVKSCHLKTPEGLELELTTDLDYPGLRVLEGNYMSSCIIVLTVTEDMNGEWELYSRETLDEEQHEIRQPFTISIEEPISTFPKDLLTIESGKDLYLRLEQSVEGLKSCSLVPPAGTIRMHVQDARHETSCGFLVPNVSGDDEGTWTIVAEGRIRYKGEVDVTVEDSSHPVTLGAVTVTQGESVAMDLGPANALYCQVADPAGSVAFSGFRACRLDLAEVARQHAGMWTLHVGLPGRLTALEQRFEIRVEETANTLNTVVQTVQQTAASATLSCSMLTAGAGAGARSCKFVRPDSAIFLVSEGVGEGRYSYSGNGASITESGHTLVECGLHIISVLAEDIGTWRCLLDAEEKVASAFLRVAGASETPEDVAPIEGSTEVATVFEATTDTVVALAGEEMTISCSADFHILYCWFRAPNGTMFSVAPGVSAHEYEYAGSGFDAGECGLRVRTASRQDAGAWTCSVGVPGERDRGARVTVVVHASPMVVSQHIVRLNRYLNAMVVMGRTYNGSSLRYCRFMSPGGTGFNSASGDLSGRYNTSGTNLSAGVCQLSIDNPWFEEVGSWAVAGVLSGRHQEIIGRTQLHGGWNGQGASTGTYLISLTIIICINVCFISILVNKRSRSWTRARVSSVGTTLRNSFRKSTTRTGPGGQVPPPTYDSAVGSLDVDDLTGANQSSSGDGQRSAEENRNSRDNNESSTGAHQTYVDQNRALNEQNNDDDSQNLATVIQSSAGANRSSPVENKNI